MPDETTPEDDDVREDSASEDEVGGSKDAADLVKDFLGREFNFKAFEDYLLN